MRVFYVALLLSLCLTGCLADLTPVAANLDGISDSSHTLPFVDLMKQSRTFGSAGTPWDGNVKLDTKGWPTEDFGVIFAVSQQSISGMQLSLSGTFASQPTLKQIACSLTFQIVNWSPSTGVLTATVTVGKNESQIMIGFVGTGGGARSLSLRMSSYPSTAVFTNEWISMLQKFELFRFMDWAQTNGNPVVTWADRTPPEYPSYSHGPMGSSGAPWEVMIDLANTVGRDMWINIPHQATDDYVTNLAQLFKKNLKPNLNLYLEYSNEVWNWQFTQATWNLNAAVAEVQAGDPNHLDYDNDNNKWYWGYRRVALRLKQITDIFAGIWGNSTINTRVRPVLAGQVVQPLLVQLGLDYIRKNYGPPNKWFYSLAGAPYFNLGDTNNNPQMTKDDVLNAMQKSIDGINPTNGVGQENWLAGHVMLAKWNGLEMRGYEGGPDTFGPNGILAKEAATLDPRMKDLCVSYLNAWVGYGFSSLNWYSAGADNYETQYGTWALTNNMENFNVPKIECIDQVRTNPPAPLIIGDAIPGVVNATNYVGYRKPLPAYLQFPSNNSEFYYIVRATKPGNCKITVWTSGQTTGSRLGVNVNNVAEQIVVVPNTGGSDKFQACPVTSFSLDKGVNIVRLLILSDRAYNIQSVHITTD